MSICVSICPGLGVHQGNAPLLRNRKREAGAGCPEPPGGGCLPPVLRQEWVCGQQWGAGGGGQRPGEVGPGTHWQTVTSLSSRVWVLGSRVRTGHSAHSEAGTLDLFS